VWVQRRTNNDATNKVDAPSPTRASSGSNGFEDEEAERKGMRWSRSVSHQCVAQVPMANRLAA